MNGNEVVAGWLVRGESTYLYIDSPDKPNFVLINGSDPVVSIEPRFATAAGTRMQSLTMLLAGHLVLTTRTFAFCVPGLWSNPFCSMANCVRSAT